MKSTFLFAVTALGLLLRTGIALCAAAADGDIVMPVADASRAGIQAASLPVISVAPRLHAYATVLDPAPLALLAAEIEALSATAAASQAEATRSGHLFAAEATVSRKATETATAIARADAARLSAARGRIGLEWGQGLAALPARTRAALIAALVEGRAALLRIGLGGTPPDAITATLDLAGAGHTLRLLGLSASSDPAYAGPSLLAVAATPGLQPGRVLAVTVSGSPQRGQRLPPQAVLADAEGRFVYIETSPGHYRRQPVQVVDEGAEGVLISGPAADARIVLHGAAAVRWASRRAD